MFKRKNTCNRRSAWSRVYFRADSPSRANCRRFSRLAPLRDSRFRDQYLHISAMKTVLRRRMKRCIEARTRLYTTSGMTIRFEPDGRAEMVALLRLIVILPDREIEERRPEVSLASKDDVIGL